MRHNRGLVKKSSLPGCTIARPSRAFELRVVRVLARSGERSTA